jgi:hypothetical protein
MDAIIPAAGLATRMRGIPKFLLPCDADYTTLIEVHIENLLPIVDTIWIPTSPDFILSFDSLNLARDRVVLLPMKTKTMTETVHRVLRIAQASHFQLVMPDTHFQGEKPYPRLEREPNLADLACWEIRSDQIGKLGQVSISSAGTVNDMRDKDPTCQYPYSWGALVFARKLLDYANLEDPHIGYAMKNALDAGELLSVKKIEGKYYDCGTPSEYLEMLSETIS